MTVSNFEVKYYPLDLTASLISNLIKDEMHDLDSDQFPFIVPDVGSFFDTGVEVFKVDEDKVTRLKFGIDYEFDQLNVDASLKAAKSVYDAITFKIGTKARIRINYHVIGEPYINRRNEVLAIYEDWLNDKRPINWDNILNKPDQFPSYDHEHSVYDIKDWGTVVIALREEIEFLKAVLSGMAKDSVARNDLKARVVKLEKDIVDLTIVVNNNTSSIADIINQLSTINGIIEKGNLFEELGYGYLTGPIENNNWKFAKVVNDELDWGQFMGYLNGATFYLRIAAKTIYIYKNNITSADANVVTSDLVLDNTPMMGHATLHRTSGAVDEVIIIIHRENNSTGGPSELTLQVKQTTVNGKLSYKASCYNKDVYTNPPIYEKGLIDKVTGIGLSKTGYWATFDKTTTEALSLDRFTRQPVYTSILINGLGEGFSNNRLIKTLLPLDVVPSGNIQGILYKLSATDEAITYWYMSSNGGVVLEGTLYRPTDASKPGKMVWLDKMSFKKYSAKYYQYGVNTFDPYEVEDLGGVSGKITAFTNTGAFGSTGTLGSLKIMNYSYRKGLSIKISYYKAEVVLSSTNNWTPVFGTIIYNQSYGTSSTSSGKEIYGSSGDFTNEMVDIDLIRSNSDIWLKINEPHLFVTIEVDNNDGYNELYIEDGKTYSLVSTNYVESLIWPRPAKALRRGDYGLGVYYTPEMTTSGVTGGNFLRSLSNNESNLIRYSSMGASLNMKGLPEASRGYYIKPIFKSWTNRSAERYDGVNAVSTGGLYVAYPDYANGGNILYSNVYENNVDAQTKEPRELVWERFITDYTLQNNPLTFAKAITFGADGFNIPNTNASSPFTVKQTYNAYTGDQYGNNLVITSSVNNPTSCPLMMYNGFPISVYGSITTRTTTTNYAINNKLLPGKYFFDSTRSSSAITESYVLNTIGLPVFDSGMIDVIYNNTQKLAFFKSFKTGKLYSKVLAAGASSTGWETNYVDSPIQDINTSSFVTKDDKGNVIVDGDLSVNGVIKPLSDIVHANGEISYIENTVGSKKKSTITISYDNIVINSKDDGLKDDLNRYYSTLSESRVEADDSTTPINLLELGKTVKVGIYKHRNRNALNSSEAYNLIYMNYPITEDADIYISKDESKWHIEFRPLKGDRYYYQDNPYDKTTGVVTYTDWVHVLVETISEDRIYYGYPDEDGNAIPANRREIIRNMLTGNEVVDDPSGIYVVSIDDAFYKENLNKMKNGEGLQYNPKNGYIILRIQNKYLKNTYEYTSYLLKTSAMHISFSTGKDYLGKETHYYRITVVDTTSFTGAGNMTYDVLFKLSYDRENGCYVNVVSEKGKYLYSYTAKYLPVVDFDYPAYNDSTSDTMSQITLNTSQIKFRVLNNLPKITNDNYDYTKRYLIGTINMRINPVNGTTLTNDSIVIGDSIVLNSTLEYLYGDTITHPDADYGLEINRYNSTVEGVAIPYTNGNTTTSYNTGVRYGLLEKSGSRVSSTKLFSGLTSSKNITIPALVCVSNGPDVALRDVAIFVGPIYPLTSNQMFGCMTTDVNVLSRYAATSALKVSGDNGLFTYSFKGMIGSGFSTTIPNGKNKAKCFGKMSNICQPVLCITFELVDDIGVNWTLVSSISIKDSTGKALARFLPRFGDLVNTTIACLSYQKVAISNELKLEIDWGSATNYNKSVTTNDTVVTKMRVVMYDGYKSHTIEIADLTVPITVV